MPDDYKRDELEDGAVLGGTTVYSFDTVTPRLVTELTVTWVQKTPDPEVATLLAYNASPGAGQYSVDLVAGSITLGFGTTVLNDQIIIEQNTTFLRDITYTQTGDMFASDINEDFNKLHDLVTETQRDVVRSIKLPDGQVSDVDMSLPFPFMADSFIKTNSAGTGFEFITGGSGDVVGPSSSVNDTIARWNGVTGLLLDDSGVIIDDLDNISGIGTLASGNQTVTGTEVIIESANAQTADTTADTLVLKSSGDTGLSILAGAGDSDGSIIFGTTASAKSASVFYRGDVSQLVVGTYKVGGQLILTGDNGVANVLLSGVLGSEVTALIGAVSVSTSLNIGSTIAVDGVINSDTMAGHSTTNLTSSTGIKNYVDDLISDSDSLQEAYDVGEVIVATSGAANPMVIKSVLADDPVASPATQGQGTIVFQTKDSVGNAGISLTSGGEIKYRRGVTANAISFPSVQAVDVDQGRSALNYGLSGEYLHWSIYSDSADTDPADSEHVTFFNVERSGNEDDATTSKSVSTISFGTTTTITTTASHGYSNGDSINVDSLVLSGADAATVQSLINGQNWNAQNVTSTQFNLTSKNEEGGYTNLNTSSYTVGYTSAGTTVKKGVTVDRLWMKMGRAEQAADGGDIIDLIDAQYYPSGYLRPSESVANGTLVETEADWYIKKSTPILRLYDTAGSGYSEINYINGSGMNIGTPTAVTGESVQFVSEGYPLLTLTGDATDGIVNITANTPTLRFTDANDFSNPVKLNYESSIASMTYIGIATASATFVVADATNDERMGMSQTYHADEGSRPSIFFASAGESLVLRANGLTSGTASDATLDSSGNLTVTGDVVAGGNVTVGTVSTATTLRINGASGSNSQIDFYESSTWEWRIRNNNTSGGARLSFTNNGGVEALSLADTTGNAIFANDVEVGGDTQIDGDLNINNFLSIGDGDYTAKALDINGLLTPSKSFTLVSTYDNASTDDCLGITAGVEGQILIIGVFNNGRTVTYKHDSALGTGQRMTLPGGADVELSHRGDTMMLVWSVIYGHPNGGWNCISVSHNHA